MMDSGNLKELSIEGGRKKRDSKEENEAIFSDIKRGKARGDEVKDD